MFSFIIEAQLKGIGAPLLTDIFAFLIFSVFVAALVAAKKGTMRRFTVYAPTLLTSLGILGTFAGIIIGLLEFDTDATKMDESIPLLLEGLKTAFISSLAGMSASICYKILVSLPFMTAVNPPKTKESIGVYDLYKVMSANTEILESIQYALGGNTNNSVSNQLVLIRHQANEFNRDTSKTMSQIVDAQNIANQTSITNQKLFVEFQTNLSRELQEFASMLSESASKHLIKALNEVISDFNNNLTEQFGDNFKLLNEAVGKLIAWQAEYKEQILHMNAQYQHGVKAITDTSTLIGNIESSSQKIPENMKSMSNTMELLQVQLNDVESHVRNMGELHRKAEGMYPEFKKQLDDLSKASTDASQAINKSMLETSGTMDASVKKFQSGSDETFSQMRKNSEKMFDEMALSITSSVQKNTDAMNAHFKNLDDAQGQQINRIAERMGEALTSITSQFTNDYKQLVDAMQQIVQYRDRS